MVKREYESSATSTKHWTGFLQRIKSPRTQPAYPPLFAVLPSKRFGRGLYARSRSPLCFGGRVARRRVGDLESAGIRGMIAPRNAQAVWHRRTPCFRHV